MRYTAKRRRTTALAVAGCCFIARCVVAACAELVPHNWAAGWPLTSTVLIIAGNLVAGTRANAIAEAAAPPGLRARYLAALQYSSTVAGLLTPLVVASFAVASWVPWLLVAVSVAGGTATLRWLAGTLPARSSCSQPRLPTEQITSRSSAKWCAPSAAIQCVSRVPLCDTQ